MTLGEKITELRERRGWTRAELGRQARIPRTTIVAYENGRFTPKTEPVKRLARALGVSLAELAPEYQEHPDTRDGTPHPCAGRPPELTELCREWDNISDETRETILAVARVGLKKHTPAAHRRTAEGG